MKWTDEQKQHLKKMLDKGLTYFELSNEMSLFMGKEVSEQSIRGMMSRNGWSKKSVNIIGRKSIAKDKEFKSTEPFKGGVAFEDIGKGQCMYMHPTIKNRCCGKTVHKGAYCEAHYNRCHVKPLSKEETDKKIDKHRVYNPRNEWSVV